MKTLCLSLLLTFVPGGERERGLALYREGKFAEAASAFRAAVAEDGDSADLQWNLALASWRAGDLPAAETAAEKYAALGTDIRTELHAGLLGAVRHDEAKALEGKADAIGAGGGAAPATPDAKPEDPLPLLEQALAKANQAKDHFVRGASANATPELLRNTERTLRTIDELQKKIDELKKQREQQKKDDDKQQDDKQDKKDDEKKDDKQDDKKDDKQEKADDKKQDDPKSDKPDDKKSDPSKADKQQPDQGKDGKSDPSADGKGEPKPEPKPDPKDGKPQDAKDDPKAKPEAGEPKPDANEKPEPKPEEKPDEKPAEQRNDAPGEGQEGKQLTPEQVQRLMQHLRELEERSKSSRARGKAGRRPVERDW